MDAFDPIVSNMCTLILRVLLAVFVITAALVTSTVIYLSFYYWVIPTSI